jgi:3-hydroxyisobutyrate dehydrogenase
MGAAMARNLAAAGLPTTVWDRSQAATAPLAEAGARVAATPAEAVQDARVVITMLPTAEVVDSVVFGAEVVQGFADGAVWAQMGTIGIAATVEMVHRVGEMRPDVMFVDAPVSGSKGPAQDAKLLVLASGPAAAEPILRPVFSAIGRKTVWLGGAGQGSELKLVVNAYLSILVEGVAEALELASRLGVEEKTVAEAIEGGPLDAPIAEAKLHRMKTGDYEPEFPLEWAVKDVDLALASVGQDSLPLLAALSAQWHHAVATGLGRADISAARLALSGV